MTLLSVIAIGIAFLCFGLFSSKLQSSSITPPILFTFVGLGMGAFGFDIFRIDVTHQGIQVLLEITLILVLFSDAARIDLNRLREFHRIPRRMLIVGMPLTIVLGTAVAYGLPLGLTFCEAGLLAAILTPTDAALGQAVVSSKSVPERMRVGLNVESGLNDGIALPIVLVFASIASALATHDNQQWLVFGLSQVTLGPLAGVVVGWSSAWLLRRFRDSGWVSEGGEGIVALCTAGLCFMIAEVVHGNGFISAFVGGLVFGHMNRKRSHFLFEFVEAEGQILTNGAFFLFGALLLPQVLMEFHVWNWVFAVFALTAMRMLPVHLSLRGLSLSLPTSLFLGWFGPRGLASILFLLLVLEETVLPNGETISYVVLAAVVLSVLAHGITAAPLAKVYGNSRFANRDKLRNVTTTAEKKSVS
ncbi:MAG: sodium:proton antiporter [Pseudomonadota bacterium]